MDIEALIPYCESVSSAVPDYLTNLEAYTRANHQGAGMISGAFQGRFLAFMSRLIQPKIVLEIGTYTGYSALCFAEGLAPGGKVHTIDIDGNLQDTHEKFIGASPFRDQIKIHYGDATLLIPELGIQPDLVFIDGAKKDYTKILDIVLPMMPAGGMILADNVLWKGRVIDPSDTDNKTPAIRAFNERVAADAGLDKFLLPIRDGLFCIRKR